MRKPAILFAALGVGVTGAILGANSAFAVPITYTEQAAATGSLDGNPFTDATVVLTMINDTANVFGGPTLFENIGTVTVSVGGGPSETFTNETEVFSSQSSPASAGFSDLTQTFDMLDTVSDLFATYDLRTSIGPISGAPLISPGVSFPTDSGAFILTTVTGNATFTATLTAAPEPTSLALLGAAFAGFGVIRRRKKR